MTKPKTTKNESAILRITNTTKKGIDLIAVEGFDLKTLLPGGNNVPLLHVKALSQHVGTRWYFERKWLVIEKDGEGDPEGPEAPQTLADYEKPDAAIAIVQAHEVIEDLQRWLANDERSVVQEAIAQRLQVLKAKANGG